MLKHEGGCRGIGNEAVNVDVGVAIGEIETGIVLVAGDQAVATEEICAGLETGDLTLSTWIGECPVMVINLLAEYPAPDRRAPSFWAAASRCFSVDWGSFGVDWSGLLTWQSCCVGVAEAVIMGAETGEAC